MPFHSNQHNAIKLNTPVVTSIIGIDTAGMHMKVLDEMDINIICLHFDNW